MSYAERESDARLAEMQARLAHYEPDELSFPLVVDALRTARGEEPE